MFMECILVGLASILEREFTPTAYASKWTLHMQFEGKHGRKRRDNIYTKTYKSENGNDKDLQEQTKQK